MKTQITIQEKLKDLRVERGLTLDQLAAEVDISRSALGAYENNDYKDISHTNLIQLAKFYGVYRRSWRKTRKRLLGIRQKTIIC